MQKRDFEIYQKRFRDFEILPKFSETHVFRGTIRHPLSSTVSPSDFPLFYRQMFHCSTIKCSTVAPSLFHSSSIRCSTFPFSLFHCSTIKCSIVPPSDVQLFNHHMFHSSTISILRFHYQIFHSSTIRCSTIPQSLFHCSTIISSTVPP